MNKAIEIDWDAEEKGEGAASYLEADREYFAIVYEYIPRAKLDISAVQRQLDFFHHIGFHPCQGARARNWQGPGILLDFGDYNSPVDPWFAARCAYHAPVSAEVIVDWPKVEERADREWDRKAELREQGIGPTEEELRAEKQQRALSDTARFVERGYKPSRWYTSYFDRELCPRKLSGSILTLPQSLQNKLENWGSSKIPCPASRSPR